MNQLSLQDAMNAMASRLTACPAGMLDEIDAYRTFDAVLEALHRDYLDARAVYARLIRDAGQNDPMTEIAADRLESCLCAFETRLIELRQDAALKQAALTRLKKMRAAMDRQDEESRRADRIWRRQLRALHEQDINRAGREQAAEADFARLMLLWQMLRLSADRTCRTLRIAHAFMRASASGECRVLYGRATV